MFCVRRHVRLKEIAHSILFQNGSLVVVLYTQTFYNFSAVNHENVYFCNIGQRKEIKKTAMNNISDSDEQKI